MAGAAIYFLYNNPAAAFQYKRKSYRMTGKHFLNGIKIGDVEIPKNAVLWLFIIAMGVVILFSLLRGFLKETVRAEIYTVAALAGFISAIVTFSNLSDTLSEFKNVKALNGIIIIMVLSLQLVILGAWDLRQSKVLCTLDKPHWDAALANGGRLDLMERARDMRYEGVLYEEAVTKLKELGAGKIELAELQEFYAFLQFRKTCDEELKGLMEIMPYCFHMHGKFHYLDENLVEASIPYKQILETIKNTDYGGYIVSEYEDHESGNAIEMTRCHQAMMRRILG